MSAYFGLAQFAVAIAAVLSLRRRHLESNPALRFLLAVFMMGGAASAAKSPAAVDVIVSSGLEPFPQAIFLLGSLLSIAAAFCVLAMLSFALSSRTTARRRAGKHLMLLIACGTAMTVLLISTKPRAGVDLLAVYAADPRVVVYQALYFGYVGIAATDFIVVIRRYLRSVGPSRDIRVGLRLEIAAACVAILWCGWGAGTGIAAAFGANVSSNGSPVTETLSNGCVALMALGAGWAVWATPVFRLGLTLWMRQAARAIAPLWQRLHDVSDHRLILDPHAPPPAPNDEADEFIRRDPADTVRPSRRATASSETRPRKVPVQNILYRRLIEIRDFQFRLRAYVHPDMRTWAEEAACEHQLSQDDTRTLIEAAQLAAAIDARKLDYIYTDNAADIDAGVHVPPNLRHEAHALISIEAMIQRSPLVNELVERARESLPSIPTPPSAAG